MGAADRDRPLEAHQLTQHFGAPNHRHETRPCGLDLRVAFLDRRRHDDDLGVFDVFGGVTHGHRDAEVAQAPDVGVLGGVAALHLVIEIVQNLGDAAHADAADADEVDGAEVEGQASHAAASPRFDSVFPL